MGVKVETCYITRYNDGKTEYQEIQYEHDTTDGRDTKTEIRRGQWVDSQPPATAGECSGIS